MGSEMCIRDRCLAGSVADLNNTGASPTTVTVQLEYRRVGATAWINALRHAPNTDGSFQVFQALPLSERTGQYEARAYVVSPGVNEGYDRWTYGTAGTPTTPETDPDPVVAAGNVLRSVTARAVSSTSVVFTATVSTGAAGTVYWRYRAAGATTWTSAPSTARAANTPVVSRTVTGLRAGTGYTIQASVNADYTNALTATVATPASATPMSITYFAATGIVRTGATLRVTVANAPSTPNVTVSIAGQPSQTSQGTNQTFTFAGLTAGTTYTALAIARAGTQTVSRSVTFTTEADATLTVRVATVRASWASITVRVQANNLLATSIVTWEYRVTGTATWTQDTGSVLTTTPTALATKTIDGLLPNTSYQIRATVGGVTDVATISTSCVPASEISKVEATVTAANDLVDKTRAAWVAAATVEGSLQSVSVFAQQAVDDFDDALATVNPVTFNNKSTSGIEAASTVSNNLSGLQAELIAAQAATTAAVASGVVLGAALSAAATAFSSGISAGVGAGTALRTVLSNINIVHRVVSVFPARFAGITVVIGGLLAAVAGLIGITFGRGQIRDARRDMQQVVNELGTLPLDASNAAVQSFNVFNESQGAATQAQTVLDSLRREAC